MSKKYGQSLSSLAKCFTWPIRISNLVFWFYVQVRDSIDSFPSKFRSSNDFLCKYYDTKNGKWLIKTSLTCEQRYPDKKQVKKIANSEIIFRCWLLIVCVKIIALVHFSSKCQKISTVTKFFRQSAHYGFSFKFMYSKLSTLFLRNLGPQIVSYGNIKILGMNSGFS